jgi:hypothetical protein
LIEVGGVSHRRLGFEFFGTARLAARCESLAIEVGPNLSLQEAFAQLARAHPRLLGDPLSETGNWVAGGYGVHLEAQGFVSNPMEMVPEKGNILIISMPAGG